MRDGKDTIVVNMGTDAVCHDCGAEVTGRGDAWRWARKHAKDTGHCPSVLQTYDVHSKEAQSDG